MKMLRKSLFQTGITLAWLIIQFYNIATATLENINSK